MKLIYIAGPYKGRDCYETLHNIMVAREAALDVWELGHAALCPHSNTALFDGARNIPYEAWYEGDIVMLIRCDGLYVCGNWRSSKGALREIEVAETYGIPIYYTKDQLITTIGECAE